MSANIVFILLFLLENVEYFAEESSEHKERTTCLLRATRWGSVNSMGLYLYFSLGNIEYCAA